MQYQTMQHEVMVQCCTFLVLFIVDVCFSTITKRIDIIGFCCQYFITIIEGIVNVSSLHIDQ